MTLSAPGHNLVDEPCMIPPCSPLRRALLIFLILISLSASRVIAQRGHIVPVEDPIYESVRALQERGYLLELNPVDLPYTEGRLRSSLEKIDRRKLSEVERYMVGLLETGLSSTAGESQAVIGFRLRPGFRVTNNGRLDPVRYLSDIDARIFQYVGFQTRLQTGPFSAAVGFRHDRYYDRDPDGLDTALRWLMRSENGYIRYDGKWISTEFGRFSRQWGLWGESATLISSNPRSYDHLGLRLGGDRLSIRTILGELDSITGDGRFSGTAGDDSVRTGSERRYIAAHRVDWRPDKNWVISILHATLYSGPNSGISLKYANPMHPVIFALDNKPKNDENNGFLGFSVWTHTKKVVLHVQGTLDDADILNLNEPASFSFSAYAGFPRILETVDASSGFTAVASRAYNTHQPEGRYIYLLRGLATQFSDYVSLYGSLKWYAHRWVHGLTITPRIDILWQGEADIRDPFPGNGSNVGTILTGSVERTLRTALQLAYDPDPRFFVRLDAGMNFISGADHESGAGRTKFIAVLEFGFRLSTDRLFRLDF